MSVIITCGDGALKIRRTASLDAISELVPYEHRRILRQSQPLSLPIVINYL